MNNFIFFLFAIFFANSLFAIEDFGDAPKRVGYKIEGLSQTAERITEAQKFLNNGVGGTTRYIGRNLSNAASVINTSFNGPKERFARLAKTSLNDLVNSVEQFPLLGLPDGLHMDGSFIKAGRRENTSSPEERFTDNNLHTGS